MISSIRRSAFQMSNRILYTAVTRKKQFQLGNRKVRIHPCNIETNSIFIHIPKTAGFSVSQAIYGMDPWHFRLRDYQEIADTSAYFTFSIVREPAARLMSMYGYLRRVRAVPPQLVNCRLAPTFRDFLDEYILQMKAPTDPMLYGQIDYLTDASGEMSVDFVARMENLTADFDVIKRRTNRTHAVLPHLNRSSAPHILNKDDLRFVKANFAEEYERLGYLHD